MLKLSIDILYCVISFLPTERDFLIDLANKMAAESSARRETQVDEYLEWEARLNFEAGTYIDDLEIDSDVEIEMEERMNEEMEWKATNEIVEDMEWEIQSLINLYDW